MRFLLVLSALAVSMVVMPYTMADSGLPSCTDDQKQMFVAAIRNASSCLTNTSYDWIGERNPTDNQQYDQLCKCSFANKISIPACAIKKIKDGSTYFRPLYVHYNWVKEQCICTYEENKDFVDKLNASSGGCATSSYPWSEYNTPSDKDRRELCNCSLSHVDVPRCTWQKSAPINKIPASHHVRDLFNCAGKKTLNVTEESYGAETEAVLTPVSTPAPSASTAQSPSSSNSIEIIAGIAGGAVIVALIIGFVVGKRRMKTNHNVQSTPTSFLPMGDSPRDPSKDRHVRPSAAPTVGTDSIIDDTIRPSSLGSLSTARFTEGGKWDNSVIAAVRIPFDAIFIGSLLSRGGFGEVLRGTYRGETVAIKRLLPERRKDLTQIDNFLSEVKLMSSLEHERIVKFIGVAWNSLSDVCMVVEFMDHGDLRSVLNRWNSAQRPDGFDADKIRIALHIAHALVYLHSLQPVVVHRDLKSKNVLLDANFDAKLTDFGIARERADVTMTGGVGSSLWMAPEVMMGKRYDEKADIFSFGVVLSELDTHQLPYSHAKISESGEKLPETAILQQVMLGRLSVAFTDRAHPELVQLGRQCVVLDPKQRPTTAQVLHRLHLAFRQFQ